jgi:hypothetical protein
MPIRGDVDILLREPGMMDCNRALEAWILYSKTLGVAMQVWIGGGVFLGYWLASMNWVSVIFCILIGLLGCALLFGVWAVITVVLLIVTLKSKTESRVVGDEKGVIE